MNNTDTNNPVRVMGLHSLTYCERLYYLEEVEKILIADDRVYAGRNLHDEIHVDNDDIARIETFEYTSEVLGLTGKVDRLQKRNGNWIPYEHKTGRSKTNGKEKSAWEPDIVQVTAYAMLIEEASDRKITEGRIKYHRDHVLVKIEIDDEKKNKVLESIKRAHELNGHIKRPAVSTNPNICIRCSLAPVCLPEENRLFENQNYDAGRLFVPHREKQTLHVTGYKTQIHKKDDTIVVEKRDEMDEIQKTVIPLNELESLVIHGPVQISAQMISTIAWHNIPLHWFSAGGSYTASLNTGSGTPQRKIRQYEALVDSKMCLYLTKKLTIAKCESQLRYLLRATRKNGRSDAQREILEKIREHLSKINDSQNIDTIRGYEGTVAKLYHQMIPSLFVADVPDHMFPDGRSRRPPRDRYNAAQSFLYSLLYKSVYQAILAVGLDPDFGFYHTPRSGASPLVLDLMELFRTPVCDISLVGSVNRLIWDVKEDFEVTSEKVWLSTNGRKKAIALYEERLNDTWKHPVTDYSLTYYRMIEMEVRFLEKEWSDQAGLFARARLR